MLPAIASTSAATHTLKFISVSNNMVVFSKKSAGFQDTDVSNAGKTIGFDETVLAATSATSRAGHVTVGGVPQTPYPGSQNPCA